MRFNKENAYIRHLPGDDKILAAKVLDMLDAVEQKYLIKFSFFLDEHQCKVAQDILASVSFSDFLFYGGFEHAKRKVLAVFPQGALPALEDFPIQPLEFLYRKSDVLTHRDFLGALLSHQIKREVLGDILVDEGKTVVFVYNTVGDTLVREISKIGSAGVKLRVAQSKTFSVQERFEEINGTVASLRSDCILSLATKLSREKAALLIKSIGVDINYEKSFSVSTLFKENDVFSLRGYGKYILTEIGGTSKKGKIYVRINKYI